MRIALVEPYHGGSHAAWAEGCRDHSVHDVGLIPTPPVLAEEGVVRA